MKMLMLLCLAGFVLAGFPTSLQAIIITGDANVFVSGQDSTGINTMGGLFPGVALTIPTPGTGQTVSFSVTGSTACGSGVCNPTGGIPADGATLPFTVGPTNGTQIDANGTNGISGITFNGRQMFLVGVFLSDSTPTGTGPFSPTFVTTGGTYNADTDVTFQPFFLGQVFYIGDGKTGLNNAGGTTQVWQIPSNATRLFLGFADAFNNFTGPWGAYGDNGGSLNVTVNAHLAAVPEPGTIMLMGLGLMGFALLRKKIA